MAKFVSVTVLVLLAGLPVAVPLLAADPCCPEVCESMLRPADSCCGVSALPETSAPARPATSPKLAAPATTGPILPDGLALRDAPTVVVLLPTPTVFRDTPLRI